MGVQGARKLASSCKNDDVVKKLDDLFNQLIRALVVLPEAISRYVPGEEVVYADYQNDEHSDKVVLVSGKCKGLTAEHFESKGGKWSNECYKGRNYQCRLEGLPSVHV